MNLFISMKYLVALDDHRHFGRAALACHVTQPALSNALRALEEGLGISIVKRGRNFAGFTSEGERVLASARRILREQELLQQDLHSSKGHPQGQLLVGAVPTAMPIAARFVALLQARHPGIVPTLRSLSSVELETGLESLALDMGLGYTERMAGSGSTLRVLPQYTEHYFLLRRAAAGVSDAGGKQGSLRAAAAMGWREAASLPLCMLGGEMHNRTIVDRAFAAAGATVRPAIETNSTVTLVMSVLAGQVCSVLPGALLGTVLGQGALEALPLVEPLVEVPIAFLVHKTNRPSRTLDAAIAFAENPDWLAQAARHSRLPAG
jgi:DNA-binding transcriptional LysR family regulator